MNKQKTRISFRLNPEYDKPLIDELSKYSSRKLSMLIRKILRDNLVYRKCEIVEDVFAEDVKDNPNTNETLASNTDNVNDTNVNEIVEVRQINKKAEINNSNNTNKTKSIKWNIPE